MGWVKKKVWLVGIAILYCFLNVAGCAKYSLKEPPKGVTKQFYPTITKTNYASGKEYDWNKLKKGYGLFVFTYKIAGKSGYTIGGAAVGVKEGIRIWEHEFESDQPDTVSFLNAFTTWKRSEPSSVGTNNMFIELTNHLSKEPQPYNKLIMGTTYIKGHIVYGGNIRVAASEYKALAALGTEVDTLFAQFLLKHKNNLTEIPIDTVSM